jgi:hypothetical protein
MRQNPWMEGRGEVLNFLITGVVGDVNVKAYILSCKHSLFARKQWLKSVLAFWDFRSVPLPPAESARQTERNADIHMQVPSPLLLESRRIILR